jgi:hypothetical protein
MAQTETPKQRAARRAQRPIPERSTGRVRHPRTGRFIPNGRVPNTTNGGHKPAPIERGFLDETVAL